MDIFGVVILLIVIGFGLWLLDQVEFIEPRMKRIIKGVVILMVIIWLLRTFWPVITGVVS